MSSRADPPAPGAARGRSRLQRALSDRLLGPGATRTDVLLALGSALAAAALLPMLAWGRGVEWSVAQWVAAAALAGDLVGGVVVNASTPARRYYFRAGRDRSDHLAFVALHLVHALVFAWLFRVDPWRFAAVLATGMLLAALLIRTAPIHRRRPVAMLCLVVGLVGSSAAGATPGMEWFVPVLLLKLLVCYLLGDVPAAPPPEDRWGTAPPVTSGATNPRIATATPGRRFARYSRAADPPPSPEAR